MKSMDRNVVVLFYDNTFGMCILITTFTDLKNQEVKVSPGGPSRGAKGGGGRAMEGASQKGE